MSEYNGHIINYGRGDRHVSGRNKISPPRHPFIGGITKFTLNEVHNIDCYNLYILVKKNRGGYVTPIFNNSHDSVILNELLRALTSSKFSWLCHLAFFSLLCN